MARRKQTTLKALATSPWPAGITAGILGFLTIHHSIAWWMGQSGGPLGQAIAQKAPAFAPIAWAVLALCCAAALASWLVRRKSHRPLDTRTGLGSLAALGLFPFPPWISPHFLVDSNITPSLLDITPNLSQSTITIHQVTN